MKAVTCSFLAAVAFVPNASPAYGVDYEYWPAVQAALPNSELEQRCHADGYAEIPDCLINRHAPQLRFHSQEENFPAPVPWYLERVHLRYSQNNCPDGDNVLDVGDVTPSALVRQRRQIKSLGITGCDGTGRYMPSDRLPRGTHGFFLQVPDESESEVYPGIDPVSDPRSEIYAHFARRHNRATNEFLGYEIQYWIFFPRDAVIVAAPLMNKRGHGAHEGDWELFKVHVNTNGALTDAFYKQHDEPPEKFSRCSITLTLDDGSKDTNCYAMVANEEEYSHPVVYVAWGKHALYPSTPSTDQGITPGGHPGKTPFSPDYTDDRGVKWNTVGSVKRLGERFQPFPGMEWIQYGGKWGEYGVVGSSSGPTGPAMKGEYCESGNKDVGKIERLDACSVPCPAGANRDQAWVAFYEKENFGGPIELHRVGSQQDHLDFMDLRRLNYENHISSLKACLPEGLGYEVYSGRNHSGSCLLVDGRDGWSELALLSNTSVGNMDNRISSGRFEDLASSSCR